MYFSQNLELLRAISTKRHLQSHIADLPAISWDDVVSCINENVCNENQITTLENFGIVLLDTGPLIKLRSVFRDFCNLNPKVPCSAHLYISLSSKSKTFGWHKDTSDVIFWQALGQTLFSVKEGSKIYEYELLTNDIIYIPAGVKHCTQPLTPRVGISLGIDYAAIAT
ncbi:MAG: hypothetical protein EBU90_09850 [Proteobacteria bacterium]|nr:hypothetical protein [Pseudomonadota bacterium]NBP14555.1 hypothetical protein [bacterium]